MSTALQSIVRKSHAKRPACQRFLRKVLAGPRLLLVLAMTSAAMLTARAADAGGINAPVWRTSFSVSHGDAVNHIAFSRDGRYLAVGSGGKDLWVIETTTGKEVARTTIGAAANSIAFSTDSRYCAVAADDATVRVLEMATGKEISKVKELFADLAWVKEGEIGKVGEPPPNGGAVEKVVFTGDSNYVVQWYNRQTWTTLVIEAATGKQVRRNGYGPLVKHAHVSSDGRYQANACDDDTLRVIEVATGKEVSKARFGNARRLGGAVGRGWYSPDTRYLAVKAWGAGSGGGHELRLLEAATAKELSRLRFEHYITHPVGFSRGGRYLAVEVDKTVQIFEVATGRKAGSVEVGEIAKMRALAFGPDGRSLAAGRNKFARVFEVATGKEVFKTEFDRDVIAVEFSPDGRFLAAHDDTTVRMIDGVPSGK